MMKYFLIFLISISTLLSAENITFIQLQGYLGKDEIAKANKALQEPSQTVAIEINSNSGDVNQVLDLAKKLYALKLEKNPQIIVYINDKAVGPAAIIPFVADKIYHSLFVSWGDIPLGTENALPTNLLRNQVISLIQANNPNADILRLMASAMVDKTFQVVEDNGWKIAEQKTVYKNIVTAPGETLVVNQHQMQSLKLSAGAMSIDRFLTELKISKEKIEQIEAGKKLTDTLIAGPKDVAEELKKHIKFDPNAPNTIGHIIIEDHSSSINQATWLYVKNALDYYKEKKPIFVILELNTPGGEVFPAQKISDALKEFDTQYGIPVVCLINNWAISAGAMLAYSCRFIAVVKDASMGAAEPVIMGEGSEMKSASEKVNSALRADFANRARFFDRNPNVAEAMVDKDVILVLRHGEILKLDNENQIRLTGPNPDIVVSSKGKLLTLNADELMKYGVADVYVPPAKTSVITAQEKESGKWLADKTLLFQTPFFKDIPQASIQSYQMDWKAKFFAILAHPMVSSLLVLGIMLGFYVEISTPGFGLPGTVALISLILVIMSSFALEIANILEVILLLIGLGLLIFDIAVLPTFGLLGFAGLTFFLVGLFGLLLPGLESVEYEFDTQSFNAAGQFVLKRVAWLCGTLILGTGIMLFLARYFTPQLASYSRLVLSGNEQDASKGYIAGDSPDTLPKPGTKGEAMSQLRPAGKILIDDKIYDAISYGAYVEKGEKIVVDRLDGSVIVVSPERETST